MQEYTEEQKKKLQKLAEIIDEPDTAVFVQLHDLEEKVDTNKEELKGDIQLVNERVDNIQLLKGDTGEKGEQGIKGEKGDRGDKGDKGEKGDTVFIDKIIEKTEIIKEIPIVTENVVEKAVTDVPEVTARKLETLQGDKRLDASAIKNLPQPIIQNITKQISGGGSGIKKINPGRNIQVTDTGNGEVTLSSDPTFEDFNYIDFNTSATVTPTEGRLWWNSTDGTLNLGMQGGNITQQIGQELFIKVINKTGSTINNGTPVYFSGRQGNRPKIIPARSDAEATSMIMGVTTEDIANNDEGYITTFGYVRQIKTNYSGTGNWGTTWSEGDKLYVSKTVAGQLTNVEPAVPHHSDIVGEVAIVGGAGIGSIFVNIDRHHTMMEMTDVDGTPLTTTGQVLVWNQTAGYWDPSSNLLTEYVPYTGATTDVDLGNYGLTSSYLNSKHLSVYGDKSVSTDAHRINGADGTVDSVYGQSINMQGGYGYSHTNYDTITNYPGGTGGGFVLYGADGGSITNDYSGIVSGTFQSGNGGSYLQVAGNGGSLTNQGDIRTAQLGNGGAFALTAGTGGSIYNEGTLDYITNGQGGSFVLTAGASGNIDNTAAITGVFSSAIGGNFNTMTGGSGNVTNYGATITGGLVVGQSGTYYAQTASGGSAYNNGVITGNLASGQSGNMLFTVASGGGATNEGETYNLFAGSSGAYTATIDAGGSISNTGVVNNYLTGGRSGDLQFTIGGGGYIENYGSANIITGGGGGASYYYSGDSSSIYNYGTANTINMASGGLISFRAGNVGDFTTDTDTVLNNPGEGGEILFYGGSGGSITDNSYTMVDTGAVGGDITFYGGGGCSTTNGDTMTGGDGGSIYFNGGAGGSSTGGATSSTGGDGGDIVFTNSYGGAGDTLSGNNGSTRFRAANLDPIIHLEDDGSYFYKPINLVDKNVILSTTTGTSFGTATNQKLAFYNSAPIVQPTATTELGTVLSDLGLRASGTAYPITTTGKGTFGTGQFGGATDYSEFETDGTLKFNGNATVFTDIDFPIIIRTTGTGIPALTTLNGNITMPQWAVNDFNICESQEFVHSWKEASSCSWHIHLTTNGLDTTNRYVRFEVEYGWVNPSGTWTFPATINTGDILIPANTADKTMLILALGSFTPSGGKIGGHVVARLKRIASTGTAPTNNPWIPMLQMHIENDTVGSRSITTK